MRVGMLGVLAASSCWTAWKALANETTPTGSNVYQMVTGDDSDEDRRHWNSLYTREKGYVYGREPAPFLRENMDFLPQGRVLDLAMGEGRNAVFLAKKGFSVDGVDISEVALRKARNLARENRVLINTVNADLHQYAIKPESYDVIVNIDYVQRSLIPQIKRGLKKGGIVVFEGTLRMSEKPGDKPVVPPVVPMDTMLNQGELRELFREFKVIKYVEINDGTRAKASLIARKM